MGDLNDLAGEIERRGLKFADVVLGHYEMLSDDEIGLIVTLLRENDEPSAEERAEFNRRYPGGFTQVINEALQANPDMVLDEIEKNNPFLRHIRSSNP